jgi:hypothetical protein
LALSVWRAGRALTDVDQPILAAIDQRPQQHAANDAENRRVGADAKGERDDDSERQPFDAGQRPEREAKIGEEAHHKSF